MTIAETILSFPGLSGFPEGYLVTLITPRALNGAEDVGTETDMKRLNLAIADALSIAVNLPDYSEGKLSEQYPRKYYLITAARIYRENGEPEKANALRTIKNPSGKSPSKW